MDDNQGSTLLNSQMSEFGSPTQQFRMSSCLTRGGEEPSLNEAVTIFERRDKERMQSPHFVQRYSSEKYNVLKTTQREVLPESLKMGRVGHNGIHRYFSNHSLSLMHSKMRYSCFFEMLFTGPFLLIKLFLCFPFLFFFFYVTGMTCNLRA
jgi:hypothetical protein